MTTLIQRVIKKNTKVTIKIPKKISQHVAMMIGTDGKKNFASMARLNNVSYRKLHIKKNELNDCIEESMQFLIGTVKNLATKENKGFLIADFTFLQKQFAQHIPSITYDYNGTEKRVSKGLSTGFIFWSNGKITVPLNFNFWGRYKDLGELYEKKTDLVKRLIKFAKINEIPFEEILLDGAFASKDMLNFLESEQIKFTIRIPKNRKITSQAGIFKLSEHPGLQLKKNQKYKTIHGAYKGVFAYFTAHKRAGTNNTKEIVYIISNVNRPPAEHVAEFAKRWDAEKCFRSIKQYLGLADCQSTNADKQKLHIFTVMTAYTVLQLIKFDKKKSSVEAILHLIRFQKKHHFLLDYIDLEQTIMS
jgi:hypothetical protein